ncbi:hypothetical protein FACS18949_04120 [Clostridia bacterium]|nr:hypothetical protein FACS189425_11080 [Clostridia bacterium]GHV32621.1 hypothetical protein FACS18949_04120 [Clostridia bacterium]
MPERYRVITSDKAKGDLRKHVKFLAIVSIPAAKRLQAKIRADIRSLSKMPHMYPAYNRPGLESGKYRRMISSKHYRVIYYVKGGMVYIDEIQDGRQVGNILTN